MKKVFLSAYILLSIINIAGNYFEVDLAASISKPLLMPALILFVLASSDKKSNLIKLLSAALVLSWVGDVVLMFQQASDLYFIFGLASFLLAHICYCILFLNAADSSKPSAVIRISATVFFSVFLMTSMKLFLPLVGDMKTPVILYSIVISFMGALAFWRAKRTTHLSYWMVSIGAILFITSDSILAFNKFVDTIPHAGLSIMLTYLSAQLMISYGIVIHSRHS